MTFDAKAARFLPVGKVVVTAGASEVLMHEDIIAALNRHQIGDWGELCEFDRKANNDACKYGDRILSAYTSAFGNKFWVITEADRSYTTILLPSEY